MRVSNLLADAIMPLCHFLICGTCRHLFGHLCDGILVASAMRELWLILLRGTLIASARKNLGRTSCLPPLRETIVVSVGRFT